MVFWKLLMIRDLSPESCLFLPSQPWLLIDLLLIKKKCSIQGGPKKNKHVENLDKIRSSAPFDVIFGPNLKEYILHHGCKLQNV